VGLDERLATIEEQGRQTIKELKRINETLEAILKELRKR